MRQRSLGPLGPVSVLSLGGGGLGQLWGETTRAECIATVHAAIDAGITLLDMAPRYGDGEAEQVIGEAFGGRLPPGVLVTTKCLLGNTPADQVEARLRRSLTDSLALMKLDRVDTFFLHSNVAPDDHPMRAHPDAATRVTAYSTFTETVRPAFERLIQDGLIRSWGLTGIGHPDSICRLLTESPGPAVVQCISNPIDSPGSLKFHDDPARPRDIIKTAQQHGVGVMGIRAVQAGALAAVIDRDLPPEHPEMRDYARAAGWRALADEIGEDPADLAHRYALSMPGVDTVVLGIKNRDELEMAISAEARGPLDPELMRRIDGTFAD